MLKLQNMQTKVTYNMEADGDVFIIPNRPSVVGNMNMLYSSNRVYLERAKKNGIDDLDENEKLIQVWIVSHDLASKNLGDHGGYFDYKNIEVKIPSGLVGSIPKQIFEGKEEGDVVDWTISFFAKELDADVNITLHLTLKQTEYRYARFGRFEEVLKKIS